jgi:hypothetical protein
MERRWHSQKGYRGIWQKCMRVELTGDSAKRPPNRFEDGETHRDPYTSI